MSVTTAGALKAWLETRGLGISVYRDQVPPNAARPYVTVMENIGLHYDPMESDSPNMGLANAGDTNYGTVVETASVDVWQDWRNAPPLGGMAESTTLTRDVIRNLHRAPLSTSRETVYGVVVRGRVRMVEEDTNIVHDAITIEIHRSA